MSRKSIQTMPDNELEEVVIGYKDAKDKEKSVKKTITSLADIIKTEMASRNVTEFVAGDIRASVTYTPKQDFNELQAIEILREKMSLEDFSKVVKTREYIDDDEFERMVYSNHVDANILAPAVTPLAPTVTLRIGKVKK